jgi:energy-coupling factor transporter ATP-binding protein EcfA2
MITLLIGKKGSGKTKKLIELANNATTESKGNVVVIEKGLKLTYDIDHKARLIDVDAYGITGLDAMAGFVSGICAGNYDVTDIFVDSTLKIIGTQSADLEKLVSTFDALSTSAATNMVLSVSAAEEDIPSSIAQYIAK